MNNVSNESSKKLNSTATDFDGKGYNSGHQLERFAQNTGEKVGSMASEFANSTADSVKASREYVQENPMKGMAVAIGAGLVAGSLLTILMRGRRD